MGIFEFLRKIIGEKKTDENIREIISLSEIDNWIDKKTNNIESKNREIFYLIKKRISNLEQEIKDKINTAEKVDIGTKKSEERIKVLVEEGRRKYIELVRNLLENLNNLEENSPEIVINNINNILVDFNKKAHINYERATILIGKEMADIKDSLKSFSNDMLNIFNENKEIISSYNAIKNIKLKLRQKEELEANLSRIEEAISSFNEKIKKKEDEHDKINNEIEKVKKSPEYSDNLSKIEMIKSFKEDLDKEFSDLRQLIDFKALANYYHIFEDKMEIVKAHRDKFQISYEKDNGEGIIGLLTHANLDNAGISDKISRINKKKEEIAKLEGEKRGDKIAELNSEKEELSLKINEFKNSIEKEKKRYDKVNANKGGIVKEISEELNRIGIELKLSEL